MCGIPEIPGRRGLVFFVAVILFWVVFKLDDIPSAEDGRIIACYELIRNL